MNDYINEYLEDTMFILLDKISRFRNVDFTQVENQKIASVVKRLAYDILVAYYYIYDEDTEKIKDYIRNDLSIKAGWMISQGNIRLSTPDGVDIDISVANEENLAGLTGSITATTPSFEIITAEEDLKGTYLSVKNENEELTLKNKKAHLIIDNEEYPFDEKISGLNSMMFYLRNKKESVIQQGK